MALWGWSRRSSRDHRQTVHQTPAVMPFARTLERWLRSGHDKLAPEEVAWSASRGGRTGTALREGVELDVVDVDVLLAPHAALVDRIRVAEGGEEGSFELQVAPLIRRFAAFLHLMPATRDAHFRGAGGCLQCGLEVGFHALQCRQERRPGRPRPST